MKSFVPVSIIVVGLVEIAIGVLVQQAMPVLGRAAYQAAAAGSYSASDYRLNLIVYYLIGAVIIGLGLATMMQDRRS